MATLEGLLARYVHRGEYTWADVVFDARQTGGSPVTAIPTSVAGPVIPEEVREVAARNGVSPEDQWAHFGGLTPALMGSVVLGSGEGRYALSAVAVTASAAKGCIATVVECPDGFRVGLVTGYYADYGRPAEEAWARYLEHSLDGLGFLFTDAYASDVAARVCAELVGNLRAFLDSAGDCDVPSAADYGHHDLGLLLLQVGMRGVPIAEWPGSLADLFDELRDLGSVTDLLASGWRFSTLEDLAWLRAISAGEWGYAHLPKAVQMGTGTRGWFVQALTALRGLREQGWTLDAMRLLHTEEIMLRVRQGLINDSPAAAPLTWEQVTGASGWVGAAGSARLASLCMQAGLSVEEVRAIREERGGLDEAALHTLIALGAGT